MRAGPGIGTQSAALVEQLSWLSAPLRDLTENWEVDLAGDLGEYLEGLAELQFTLDGGETTLNFAEAALLIQGSACVYSKKVEYLHALVYNALEALSRQRRRTGILGRRKGGAAGEVEEEDDYEWGDMEEEFLNLDDCLEEGDDIDMDELKSRAVTPASRPPMSVLCVAGENGRIGTNGELKMSTSYVHRSGALLLEQRDLKALDENLVPLAKEVADAIMGAGPNGIEDDGDDLADFDFGPAGEEMLGDYHGGTPSPANAATPKRVTFQEEENGVEEDDDFDPYEPLDPDDTSSMQPKPFRKGATRIRKQARGEVSAQSLVPRAKLSGPTFKEFDYAYAEIARVRRANLRAEREGALLRNKQSSFAVAEAEELMEEEAMSLEDGFADFDAGVLSDDDVDGGDIPAADIVQTMEEEEEGSARGGAEHVTYEALCRQHIDRIIAAAAAEEVQTELAQRVTLWQSKIEPMLEAAESVPAFDIRVYEQNVIHKIEGVKVDEPESVEETGDGHPVVLFQKIVRAMPKYEICRLFAATLQLVNEGNVGLIDEDSNTLKLELRNCAEAFSRLDEFRVPSVTVEHPSMSQGGRKAGDSGGQIVDPDVSSPSRKAARVDISHTNKENVPLSPEV